MAGLALGGHGNNKAKIVEEGAMRPLVDLIRFPDVHVQLAACIAINSIILGTEQGTKSAVTAEHGIEPLINLVSSTNREVVASAIYALGSLCENEDAKTKVVELGGIGPVVRQCALGDIEIKRAAGYFFANICEQIEFHGDLEREGALAAVISMSVMEDIELQEYAAFSLAHLASNRDNQVKLVEMGVVRPLVSMLASDAEPKHYAGLALLKLADNFENHLRIAEEGGIQALLRLGRTRTTDDQMQYKAALTLGQLATNAVKLLPSSRPIANPNKPSNVNLSASLNGSNNASQIQPLIGTGSRVMSRLRGQVAAHKERGRDMTIDYLDRSLAQTQQEQQMRLQAQQLAASLQDNTLEFGPTSGPNVMRITDNLSNNHTQPLMSRSVDVTSLQQTGQSPAGGFLVPGQTISQTALQIGMPQQTAPRRGQQGGGGASNNNSNV